MTKLVLYIVVLVSSKLVFAAPQTCRTRGFYDYCEEHEGCCLDGDSCRPCDQNSLPAILAIVGVVVLVGKCTLVMYCCHIRSRNIQVYSRVHVSLREADELQHQQAPTRVPPVYNPRAFQDDTNNPVVEPPSVYTPNFRINPIQRVENNRNTNNVDGVEQGHRMAPQSAFPLQNLPSQSTNSAQTYQTQGVAGNVEQTNAVPQVSFTVPPSINPASFSDNTSQNAT